MKHLLNLPALGLAAALGATTASAAVQVYGEATSTGPNVRVQVYADITGAAIVSHTFKLFYNASQLQVLDAHRNEAVWYFHNGINTVPQTPPVTTPLGEVLFVSLSVLEGGPRDNATFGEVPKLASSPKSYPVWGKALQKWVSTNETITLFRSPSTKQTSHSGESERDFRIRLQVGSREQRDVQVEKLRGKYATKLTGLQERIRKAEQAVTREQAESTAAKMDTMISVGSAVLGAIFGRGKVSASTIGKVGTAARGAGRVARQSGDVTRAGETVEALSAQYQELESALQGEIDALGASFDSQTEQLEEIVIKAKAGDVVVPLVALAWNPV